MMSHNYCGGEDCLIALGQTRAIEQFIVYLEDGKGYSKETLDLYHNYLTKLLEFFVRYSNTVRQKPFWSNFDKRVVESYNSHLYEKGDTEEMIANRWCVITSFFNYMVSNGMLGINPLEDIHSKETTP